MLERGRLAVDDDLRLVGCTNTFALGDLSARPGSPWPASAQVAMQQGDATAAAIAQLRMEEEPQPFQFEDRGEMLSLGVGEATLTGMGLTLPAPWPSSCDGPPISRACQASLWVCARQAPGC